MSALPSVAILHAPYGAANLVEIVRAARDVCRVRFVFRREIAVLDPELPRLASALADCTVLDEQDNLPPRFAADGVLTFTDSEIDHADELAATMSGSAGPADSPWDKLVQRQSLRRCGLSTADAVPVAATVDLTMAAEALGFPFVVKPRRGVRGRGVHIIRDNSTLDRVRAIAQAPTGCLAETWHPDGSHPAADPLLADFVSVEMVSAGGVHHSLAIFDKAPVYHVDHRGEVGMQVSGDLYPSRLPDAARDDVLCLVTRALTALGVTNRVTHTEVKLTPHGPEIIEVNGRMGGDLARLTSVVGGPDLVRSALLAALGTPAPTGTTRTTAAAGVYPGFADLDGTVRSMVRRSTVLRLPDVVRVDHVATHNRPRSEAGGRAVDVVVTAPDPVALADHVAHLSVALVELFALDQLEPRQWLSSCAARCANLLKQA